MDDKTGRITCMLTCWVVALLGGILIAALLMILADFAFMAGLFIGVIFTLIVGLLLNWAFCRDLPQPMGGVEPTRAPGTSAAAAGAAGAGAAGTASASAATSSAPATAAKPAAAKPAAKTDDSPKVKPSTSLAGEAELAERKGDWSYDGSGSGDGATPAKAASPAASDAESTPDYDGDGVKEGKNEGTRPEALDGPRGGKADNLKEIKGVGPKMEKLCNSLGFYHFDQIAKWTKDEVAWVDANLEGFKGRVTRDNWVEQAQILASGGETEFSKRVEDGDVY